MSLVYTPSPISMSPSRDSSIYATDGSIRFSCKFNGYFTDYAWINLYYQDIHGLWKQIETSVVLVINPNKKTYNEEYFSGLVDVSYLSQYVGSKVGWEVMLTGAEISLVADSDTPVTNSFYVLNSGIETGDEFAILTNGGSSVTSYYINLSGNNRGRFYTTREGALQAASAVIVPYTTLNNRIVKSIAKSQIIPFYPVKPNTILLDIINPITQINYTFIPTWLDSTKPPIISKWKANLFNSQKELIDTSDVVLNSNLKYEFKNALLSGNEYFVEFDVTDFRGYNYNTGLVAFDVLYDTPSIGYSPTATVSCKESMVTVDWSGVKNIVGDTNGGTYVVDFLISNNYGYLLSEGNYLSYSVDMPKGQLPTFIWRPSYADWYEEDIVFLDGEFQSARLYYENTPTLSELKLEIIDKKSLQKYTNIASSVKIADKHAYLIGFIADNAYIRDLGEYPL